MHIRCLTNINYILILNQGTEDLKKSGYITQLRRDIEDKTKFIGGLSVIFLVFSDPHSIRIADVVT